MSIGIGIVAHASRFDMAEQLAKDVEADHVSMDYGDANADSARSNHLVVWAELASLDTTWTLVLEDDAVLSTATTIGLSHLTQSFREELTRVLDAAPTRVVSLYLGTGNPKHWQPKIERALKSANTWHADWLVCRSLIHAVAVVVPTVDVRGLVAFLGGRNGPIDEDITRWAMAQGYKVSYCIPSLVDHADGPTLIAHADGKARPLSRRAWVTGSREHWNSNAVKLAI